MELENFIPCCHLEVVESKVHKDEERMRLCFCWVIKGGKSLTTIKRNEINPATKKFVVVVIKVFPFRRKKLICLGSSMIRA